MRFAWILAAALGGAGLGGCTVAEVTKHVSTRETTTASDVEVAEVADGAEADDAADAAEATVEETAEATGAETIAETGAETSAETSAEPAGETIEETVAEAIDETIEETVAEAIDETIEATGAETIDETATAPADVDPDSAVAEVEPDTLSDTSAPEVGPTCTTTFKTYAPLASPHVAICSEVVYEQNPPTSGPHYFAWAAYKRYALPVPRPNYVHDLEHGGVVVLYNCPDGCPDEVDAVWAALEARPADPRCTAPLTHRYVLTPDPLLPEGVRLAAVAWGHALTSDCFDLDSLGAFIDAYYAHAPEDSCSDGQDPTDPESPIYCPVAP